MNIREEKLSEFKHISQHRLDPEGILVFFFGSIFLCSIFMLPIVAGLIRFGWDYYEEPFERIVVVMELILYVIQLVFLLFYLFTKNCYKFQKLQTLVLLLYAFQTATIMFTMYVLPGIVNYTTNLSTIKYIGYLLLGAIIVHLIYTRETFTKVEKGGYDLDGDMSYSFPSKIKIWTLLASIVYVIFLFVLIIIYNDYHLDIYFGMFVGTVVMYSIAIGAAVFQLLAYCRFKFPSFNISWEQRKRELERYRKNKLKKKKRTS
ncbi:hypothetical protein QUF84_09515 [Fictibacillus enclensis]|uniref:hypothetical protein n=1 Tax=Fictibacillus enclensis TaxID=1017270 RepID=UPI0025A05685|nr:hypothetical protein [Fictibacillus enclensis]MDM5337452.1 hypothetical protein [Fictibacillus enclensis]